MLLQAFHHIGNPGTSFDVETLGVVIAMYIESFGVVMYGVASVNRRLEKSMRFTLQYTESTFG